MIYGVGVGEVQEGTSGWNGSKQPELYVVFMPRRECELDARSQLVFGINAINELNICWNGMENSALQSRSFVHGIQNKFSNIQI